MQVDVDSLHDFAPSDKSGEYALWLRIFTLSFFELRNGWNSPGAESFLFDQGNPFFDLVADELGYEPDNLRNRIGEALRRPG
jgi:hypothetical protein